MHPLRVVTLLLCLIGLASAAERLKVVSSVCENMGPEQGCYGDQQAITRNTDRLAREGGRFTRFIAGRPPQLQTACDEWLKKTDDKAAIPVEQVVATGIITKRSQKYAERAQRGAAAVEEELKQ
jgi:hypothetical protein